MLALSIVEGFAPKLFSRSSAPLPVPKTPASKSPVSITSKLIETKALQVPYFGHLRKTGGRGSNQFAVGYLACLSTLRATEHGPQSLYHSPACPELLKWVTPSDTQTLLQRAQFIVPLLSVLGIRIGGTRRQYGV
jgi:hypothetical protein